MISIDKRFDSKTISLLKTFVGREIECLRCDPFFYSTSVYGIVGIKVENQWIAFTNFIEVLDHYGADEDVAVFKANKCEEQDIRSFTGEKMIDIPIEIKITGVDIINENLRLYNGKIQTYDVWVTRGVIFKLDNGREISLEKDVWFSEDIIVERGENLVGKFVSTNEFVENFDGQYRAECHRETMML